jgi:hypothetical protein
LRSARLPLDGSPAADRRRELPTHRLVAGQGNYICGFYGAHLPRKAVATPRQPSEKSQWFQCGKAANPAQWCLLIPALFILKVSLDIYLRDDHMCAMHQQHMRTLADFLQSQHK